MKGKKRNLNTQIAKGIEKIWPDGGSNIKQKNNNNVGFHSDGRIVDLQRSSATFKKKTKLSNNQIFNYILAYYSWLYWQYFTLPKLTQIIINYPK